MYCKEDCCPCPIGTDCNAAILLPITLADLPLSPGYFRPNSSSIDVRRCPDAAANCDVAESTCLNSTSACVGGRDTKRGCLPGINGTFCRGCEDPNSFYVGAVEGAYATCRPCVEVVSGGTLEVVIVAAIVLAVGMILSALYALYVRVLARAGRDDEVANLSQALHDFTTRHTLTCKAKILVGFYMIATKIEDVYEVFLPPDVRLLLSRMRVVALVHRSRRLHASAALLDACTWWPRGICAPNHPGNHPRRSARHSRAKPWPFATFGRAEGNADDLAHRVVRKF